MEKIERLKREALESCRFRGHEMERFLDYKGLSVSVCKICEMEVAVIPRPSPNGIEIGGEAVALHCKREVCTRSLCDCVNCKEC
jgi:hypothetical protein